MQGVLPHNLYASIDEYNDSQSAHTAQQQYHDPARGENGLLQIRFDSKCEREHLGGMQMPFLAPTHFSKEITHF